MCHNNMCEEIFMRKIPVFERELEPTCIQPLSDSYGNNCFFIKRDDCIPFSFGGNKARKAAEFYRAIQGTDTDVVMTYGSNSSNHCRIIANMAAGMGISCHIISPEENRELLNNTKLVQDFGAVIETCPVTQVAQTIENRKRIYREQGKHPYFIAGGGHGSHGTEAYVKAYREIEEYENNNDCYFDYIFHASGTGTTQAGLVCGSLLSGAVDRKIVGISIAREAQRGRQVVKDSIREYLGERFEELYREESLVFVDAYRCGGYGLYTEQVIDTIETVMRRDGVAMDTTYVGKAFCGMLAYLEENGIRDKRILFLHTGGGPLFFDGLTGGALFAGKS
ncbi:MAG: pyridoxal-phosphate dependent enzyme [Muribaculaceae bacterium]|nr:pyridoxal-phosphate dependent enzyme [Muribaculaceae bacterium]